MARSFINEIGLDDSLRRIITVFEDHSTLIQRIEYPTLKTCCEKSYDHITFEELRPRKRKLVFYCHGCDNYQRVKYRIVATKHFCSLIE